MLGPFSEDVFDFSTFVLEHLSAKIFGNEDGRTRISNIQKVASLMGKSDSIHTWLLLWKSTRAVEIYAQRSIQCLGLGLSDFAVLEALLHKGPLLINAIGNKVLLTSGSMTFAVNRLEQQGLVERHVDPRDGRARLVNLTPKGEKLITKAFEQHADDINDLMSVLSGSERDQLMQLLRKVGKNAAHLAALPTKGKPKTRKGG